MIKKLSKYGNSFAILIDKPILELLNINEKTQLIIKTDGNRIIIEPIQKALDTSEISEDEKLQKIYEKIVKKYGNALKKLADN
jgi:antitoxin MazE